METKSRNEILLDERINQVDDINLDKLFDSDVMENNDIIIPSLDVRVESENLDTVDSAFSIEVAPNEFLDNLVIGEEKTKNSKKNKSKINISNKLLFFSLTSIAVLLSILFIYNLFVLGSLNRSVNSLSSVPSSIYVNTTYNQENDYISFDNGSHVEIVSRIKNEKKEAQTNWFNSLCDNLSHLFGGKN